MVLKTFDLKNALKNTDVVFAWERVRNEKTRKNLNTELLREVDVGHPLYGGNFTAIFYYIDDVVYLSLDNGRVAEVHLTFCPKDTPPFPLCDMYDSLEHWYEESYFVSLDYPLSEPDILNDFEKIVLGYALNCIDNQAFKQYINSLDKNNLPFNGIDYTALMRLDFDDKENVILFLNQWYQKRFFKEGVYNHWENGLMDFYHFLNQNNPK